MSASTSAIKRGNEISPEIPSGFPKYKYAMVYAFVAFTAIYFLMIATFPQIQRFLQLPPSADEFCENTNNHPCWRGDLFSFEVVSGIALMWCGAVGFYAWHIKGIHRSVPATPEGRLFGYIEEAHQLTAVGTTFQVFDLFISLLIPEQRQPLFLCHHLMAATVSWYGLNNQYFHYYGVFYLGCSEISTIPLVFMDLAKYFPPVPGSSFDFFVGTICGPLFAMAFVYYRVFLWWKVGYQMFRDIFHVLGNGMADKLRPGRNHVLYVMMALNLVLGFLQLYWFGMILKEAAKMVGLADDGLLADDGADEKYE